MRVAFVVGFYEPVRKALEARFVKQLLASSLIWVGQLGVNREPDLGMLASQLAQQLTNGAKDVLITMAITGGKDWVRDSAKAIVDEQLLIHRCARIQLCFETKAADSETVANTIEAFGLPEPSDISLEVIRLKLGGGKAICVVMDGHANFEQCMSRAGFPPECICDEFFDHMIVPRGKNSNLMGVLFDKADYFEYLLYAWTGLRTLPASVKRRFSGKAFEAPTAHDVVNLFKRWLLGQ